MNAENIWQPEDNTIIKMKELLFAIKGLQLGQGNIVEELELGADILRFQILDDSFGPLNEESHQKALDSIVANYPQIAESMDAKVETINSSTSIKITTPEYTPTPPLDMKDHSEKILLPRDINKLSAEIQILLKKVGRTISPINTSESSLEFQILRSGNVPVSFEDHKIFELKLAEEFSYLEPISVTATQGKNGVVSIVIDLDKAV